MSDHVMSDINTYADSDDIMDFSTDIKDECEYGSSGSTEHKPSIRWK